MCPGRASCGSSPRDPPAHRDPRLTIDVNETRGSPEGCTALAVDLATDETVAMETSDLMQGLAPPLASAALDVVDNTSVITDRDDRIVSVNPAPTGWDLERSRVPRSRWWLIWGHVVQQQLEDQARTDPLTGLANRLGLLTLGAQAMARARRSGRPVTVVFIDLDAFEPINDRYGHHAGDEVLKRCAQRLTPVVRETDGLARVGGDEFAVVCEDLDQADLGLLEARIGQALPEPIDIEVGIEVAVGASIGTIQVDGTADPAQTIADADERMYDAKRQKVSAS